MDFDKRSKYIYISSVNRFVFLRAEGTFMNFQLVFVYFRKFM